MWSTHRWRQGNCWFSCTSALSSSPSPFHLLDFVSLRKANLEVSAHHVRPQAGDGRTWQQVKVPHPLLSPLPPSTRPRFGFLEPMAPTTFFITLPSWPDYCSLLCFLPQQHRPWQCLQGVQDDMRHHQIYVIFFHAFLVWGSTMHPAGLTSMVPGHAASFALWELVQSSISQIYVHPPPTLVTEEICSF